ncbi:MAG TPA: hypothetical protein VGH44_06100 [Candidatus Saccharimonadia bacterium]|jgi:hypothetical protein
MKQYQRFIFESYEFNPDIRVISLHYSLDDELHFTETFTLPGELDINPHHPDLDRALFALHLSGGASYYKTYCPRAIEIRSGQLSASQAKFWNELYTHGLGEFFYRNQLDFRGLIKFPSHRDIHEPNPQTPSPRTPKRALVPFGGGKDSIVSTEILRQGELDLSLLRVKPHALITTLAATASLPLIEVERTIDQKLLDSSLPDAYLGHVPITAHLSFLAIVVSLLAGYDSVFFSNERSSSYGNVDYLGMEVNHQWSKSLESEQALRAYISAHVTPDVQYLNVVRPLSELHIAKIFTRYPEYFNLATSCNLNWRLVEHDPGQPRWCGHCPKCAFTFALMAAFLPSDTVIEMFGRNLFDNAALLPLYRQLWGTEGFKPFECVGTPEEAQAACYLAQNQPGFAGTPVIKAFQQEVKLASPDQLVHELMTPNFKLSPPITKELLAKGGVA